MPTENTPHAAISRRAVSLIGAEKVNRMSPQQHALLDRELDRLVEKYGNPEAVPREEIIGEYEMITQHAHPTA